MNTIQTQENYGRIGGWLIAYLYQPGPWDTRWQLHHCVWWPWRPTLAETRVAS